uniref:Uncharacterized protein n=1 Tax=Siphoviridae sp. ctHjy10 TaxID=2826234 RepID=A0A8S5MC06_9CAUD|nr:MAG TPA: hypothetical protein [Siphoviridae sp. ctHjy10]
MIFILKNCTGATYYDIDIHIVLHMVIHRFMHILCNMY